MAQCKFCHAVMGLGVGCTANDYVVFESGRVMATLPLHVTQGTGACHDCAAPYGARHHPGCDDEVCPQCGGQLISCECSATMSIGAGDFADLAVALRCEAAADVVSAEMQAWMRRHYWQTNHLQVGDVMRMLSYGHLLSSSKTPVHWWSVWLSRNTLRQPGQPVWEREHTHVMATMVVTSGERRDLSYRYAGWLRNMTPAEMAAFVLLHDMRRSDLMLQEGDVVENLTTSDVLMVQRATNVGIVQQWKVLDASRGEK